MDFKDKIKYERLTATFSRNFRVTELYAAYLERFPDVITKDMIEALTGDGAIKKEDAIAALLSEIFGLDTEGNAEDRMLFRDYILPSVRILNKERYIENPYYKNIKLPEVKVGNWEFKNEVYPAYRGVIANDIMIKSDFSEIPPLGFFTEDFHFPAVLEDGNEWMTLTPVDLDTSDEAIELARGKVITFGLGLGYYAYMVSEKAEVKSITVVEKSDKVIQLFTKYVLPQFSHPEKVRIVNCDAFEYAERIMPSEGYDLAFVDTWRDASDGAPMYERMKPFEKLSPKTRFVYWIENFLRSRIRAERFVSIREAIRSGKLDIPYSEIERQLSEI